MRHAGGALGGGEVGLASGGQRPAAGDHRAAHIGAPCLAARHGAAGAILAAHGAGNPLIAHEISEPHNGGAGAIGGHAAGISAMWRGDAV
jgi:hypothetical protein